MVVMYISDIELGCCRTMAAFSSKFWLMIKSQVALGSLTKLA